jgi:dUTP pyrophosphatase
MINKCLHVSSPRVEVALEVAMTTMPIDLRVKVLDEAAQLPRYETADASGMDLRFIAWRDSYAPTGARGVGSIGLLPGERAQCFTGLAFEVPHGYEMQIRPRSGLSLRQGIVAVFGTIDADYRGEVSVTLVNMSDEMVTIAPGDRIAQAVLAPVVRARLVPVAELSETERGEGGFGSTGTK